MVPRRSTDDTPNPDHMQGEVDPQSASGTGSRSHARQRHTDTDGAAPVRVNIAALPGWKRDAASWLDTVIVANVPGVRGLGMCPLGGDPGVQARLTTHQARGECGMIVLP
jgi:hypothetical protein